MFSTNILQVFAVVVVAAVAACIALGVTLTLLLLWALSVF
jgi:hypothetical protein